MFGLASVEMGIAYIMCVLAALLCLVYGIWKRNEGGPTEKGPGENVGQKPEDQQT